MPDRSLARRLALLLAALAVLAAPVAAQGVDPWTDVEEPESALADGERWIVPERARIVRLDGGALAALLAVTPSELEAPRGLEGVELVLPAVEGGSRRYRIVDSPVMAPELAARYPELRTFRLIDAEQPGFSGRGDWTPQGFHAVVRTASGTVYVDPLRVGDSEHHQVYYRADLRPRPDQRFVCEVEDLESELAELADAVASASPLVGLDLRTYRLALAATGEYTQFHGGTVPAGMAAIVTAVNRVNEVYERDVALRMVLVANNDLVVYTNGTTDPYTNNNGSAMLNENTTNLNAVIGVANYDIGHVFSTGGGGVATLNGPCGANKARGVTGLPSPIGDPFYIDYVAHEMGHQWGAAHTFNGNASSCSGNRSAASAYEPGSGSTIMAYAGICGAQNLQSNSDAYFHRRSLDQMQTFSRTGTGNTCAAVVAVGNEPPVVEAGPAYTIPRSTPFALTGSATDPDGDPLTYCWEQWDLGPAGAPNSPSGDAPIFRSFDPTPSPTRLFPKLSDLLGNTQTIGEILPTYARTLNFRLTARDNVLPAGTNAFDSTSVAVDAASGPFLVTSPNTALVWNGYGPHTVTWDVVGTDQSPVSCAAVDIRLSTDGGVNFDRLLDTGIPNQGTRSLYVGVPNTATARIQVACTGNIFFDISNTNFSITAASNLIFANDFEQGSTILWSLTEPGV